jgi:hypothetical protein
MNNNWTYVSRESESSCREYMRRDNCACARMRTIVVRMRTNDDSDVTFGRARYIACANPSAQKVCTASAMARCTSLIWSFWSLILCSLQSASCYEELSKVKTNLLPTSRIVELQPPETCNHTLFVFFAATDNYSIVAADGTLLAGPEEECLDPSVDSSINGSKMITHDYDDYVFEAFGYIVDGAICGNDSTFYSPVICAYENEPASGKKRVRIKSKISAAHTAISILFTSTSLICSSLLIATYSIFKNLRTLPGQTVLNLAVAFFLSDAMAIVFHSILSSGTIPSPWLFIIQTCWFNSRFMWMSIVGYEISRHVYLGMTLHFDSPMKKRRMLAIYLAVGWVLPVAIGVVSAAVEYSGAEAHQALKLFAANGAVVLAAPIGLSLLFNVGVAIFLMVMLRIAAKRRDRFRGKVKKGTIQFSKVFLVVLSTLGFTWLATILLLTSAVEVAAFTYITLVLNTTQPIFVAVAFLGNKKTLAQYATLLGCRKEDPLDTSSTTHLLRRRMTRFLSLLISEREFNTFRNQSSHSRISRTSILTRMGSSFKSKHPPSSPTSAKTAKEIPNGVSYSSKSGGTSSEIDMSSSVMTYVSGNFSALVSSPPELVAIPEYDIQDPEDGVLVNGATVNGDKPELCGSTEEMTVDSGGDAGEEDEESGKRNMQHYISESSITPLSPWGEY